MRVSITGTFFIAYKSIQVFISFAGGIECTVLYSESCLFSFNVVKVNGLGYELSEIITGA